MQCLFRNGTNCQLHETYPLENDINGTAYVDVDKVHGSVGGDELSTAGHGVSVGPTELHAKHILRFVSLQQGPFTLLALWRGGGGEG